MELKKKMFFLLVGTLTLMYATASAANEICTRDELSSAVEAYFQALQDNDPSTLPLADDVIYTENDKEVKIGRGLWRTAGTLKYKISALDTQTGNSVSEAVITERRRDIVIGVRLKLTDNKISEIECIIARGLLRTGYLLDSEALLDTVDEDWESILPQESRSTREELAGVADLYFENFPDGACNFTDTCLRSENGFGVNCTAGMGCSEEPEDTSMAMNVRLHVIDEEAGIAVGFVKFSRIYTDFHMFKVENGMVQNVHAVLALAIGDTVWDD